MQGVSVPPSSVPTQPHKLALPALAAAAAATPHLRALPLPLVPPYHQPQGGAAGARARAGERRGVWAAQCLCARRAGTVGAGGRLRCARWK